MLNKLNMEHLNFEYLTFKIVDFDQYLVFSLVFRPMRKPDIHIICLFISYIFQTALSILAFISKKASLYVSVWHMRSLPRIPH